MDCVNGNYKEDYDDCNNQTFSIFSFGKQLCDGLRQKNEDLS